MQSPGVPTSWAWPSEVAARLRRTAAAAANNVFRVMVGCMVCVGLCRVVGGKEERCVNISRVNIKHSRVIFGGLDLTKILGIISTKDPTMYEEARELRRAQVQSETERATVKTRG